MVLNTNVECFIDSDLGEDSEESLIILYEIMRGNQTVMEKDCVGLRVLSYPQPSIASKESTRTRRDVNVAIPVSRVGKLVEVK